jgi:hypothetical protein
MIQYLSPTSISLFQKSPEAFVEQYVLKAPRMQQTQPMAAGSAFDAYVKSYLYQRLIGQSAKYELAAIFEAQVEEHNRDWAWKAGDHIFREYQKTGSLVSLLAEMEDRIGDPKFEFTVQENIQGVELLGKPDIFFVSQVGARVIYDWKVNGYCSKSNTSPAKGYIRLNPGAKMHRQCTLLKYKGILINVDLYLEDVNKSWADQLAIYSWIMGEEVGSTDTVFGIDQVCGPADKLRFASHRLRIKPEYQKNLFDMIKQMWDQIQNDHYFLDLSPEESRAKVERMRRPSQFDWMYAHDRGGFF